MDKSASFAARWLAVVLAAQLGPAHAVCLDPETGRSGYRTPLDVEARRADAIVVGRVLAEQDLQEDPGDPDGVTARVSTIEVLDSLKARVPRRLVLRNENTSSRYAMGVGETHLLFLSRGGGELRVDSCGNSAILAGDRRVVMQVRRLLHVARQPGK